MVAAGNMGLPVGPHLFLRNCFRKSRSPTLDIPTWKQNLTSNGHSRFTITCFVITGKPTRDSLSLCHNAGQAGLTSKVSKNTGSENTDNWCCRQRHFVPGNAANISTNFYGGAENGRPEVGRPEKDRPNWTKNGRDGIGRPENVKKNTRQEIGTFGRPENDRPNFHRLN